MPPTTSEPPQDGAPLLMFQPPDQTLAESSSQPSSPPEPPSPSGQGTTIPRRLLSEHPSPNAAPGARPPRTDTWATDLEPPAKKVGGDAREVAKFVGGLLLLITGGLHLLARRTNRGIRQPTTKQRDDIAVPIARILVRHLPLEALDKDLADATAAVVATHDYAMDGQLITRIGQELPPESQLPPEYS